MGLLISSLLFGLLLLLMTIQSARWKRKDKERNSVIEKECREVAKIAQKRHLRRYGRESSQILSIKDIKLKDIKR